MTARKKKGTTALAPIEPGSPLALPGNWEAELEQYVQRDAASATGGLGWSFVGTRGGVFTYGGEPTEALDRVIIVGAARINTWYEGDFNPDSPTGPTCYAIDKEGDESVMAPPTDLKSQQNDGRGCPTCWANAFGTANQGRGKACKNGVRLCLLPYEEGGNFEKVEGARLNLPPTALKGWSAYSAKVTKGLRRPLFTMVTQVKIKPDPKTVIAFDFEPIGAIQDEDTLRILKARVDGEVLQNLYAEPQTVAEEEGKTKRTTVRRTKAKKPAKKRSRAKG